MAGNIQKYNLAWKPGTDPLRIELAMIKRGGRWKDASGRVYGNGLKFHHKAAQTLVWPEDDWHRWAELFLEEITRCTVLGIMGPANSNKTYATSKFALTDYWAAPNDTCSLISSTDVRGLELRVWGNLKDLFNRARARYPWLPGHVLESLHCITTDNLDDEHKARVLKKGIICIPCLAGGKYVGLGKYVGVKQKRVRLFADEAQFMGPTFLDAISNLSSNPDFLAGILGNPIDPLDPLGRACEPKTGWLNHQEPTKTSVWDTRFMNGRCINFVGTDSPNFEYPPDQPPRYPYLVNQKRIDEVAAFWGKDSAKYYEQVIGVLKTGLLSRRVLTRDLCLLHHALDKAFWAGSERTKIYAVDAAYSGTGGDRCVGGWIEFGEAIGGTQIIRVNPPSIIPVNIRIQIPPEDQIAVYVHTDTDKEGIEPENIFYDSTGRGTLGAAFAREFKGRAPVPVEFGGRPSPRPVRHDLFVLENPTDPTSNKRLKRCDEHYYDKVTELWFSSRYVVECDQMRELPESVMLEGCSREYGTCAGNKIFVESKHDPKARERMPQSPDLYDWLVTAIEGARQRGFKIQKLGAVLVEDDGDDYLEKEEREYQSLIRSKQLQHT